MSLPLNADIRRPRECIPSRSSIRRSRHVDVRTAAFLALSVFGLAANGCDGVIWMDTERASETGGSTVIHTAQGGSAGQSTTRRGNGGTGGNTLRSSTRASTLATSEGGRSYEVETRTVVSLGTGGTMSGGSGGTSAVALSGATSGGTSGTGQTGRKGMTWGKLARFYLAKLEWLGCNGEPLINGTEYCNAIVGDTYCSAARPILCLEDVRAKRPAYTVPETPPGEMNDEYYAGWAGGRVATTTAIAGTELTSRARADELCLAAFGASWRMAEFHDGWWISGMSSVKYVGADWDYSVASDGGWSFFASVDSPVTDTTRFWIAINDRQANCWDIP